jgi:hypothetical protein
VNLKQYKKLSVPEKLLALADTMEVTARRCTENLLIKDTWVQESFQGTADRLRELHAELIRKQ